MSKIGRKPIDLGSVSLQIDGQKLTFKGKGSDEHILPAGLRAELVNDGKQVKITCDNKTRDINPLWGLHRALLLIK